MIKFLFNSIHYSLSSFFRKQPEHIETHWGGITPKVDLFPVVYLIFMYGLVYILPFGRNFVGMSWFDWCRSEDGPLEWLQFFAFLGAFIQTHIHI